MTGPFRFEPALAAHQYKTYSIRSPIATHTRPATCAEFDCEAYVHGWTTTVDLGTQLGRDQADYIRQASGRHFVEEKLPDGLVAFHFPSEQKCFAASSHRVPLDRPEFYTVRHGDHRIRVRPDEVTRHSGAAAWLDDFGTHQDKLARVLNRG